MKTSIKFLLAATLIVVSAAGAFYWQYQEKKRIGSAVYALGQVQVALEKRDRVVFEKYVDTHKVSLSILASMLEEENGAPQEADGLLESVGRQLTSKLGKRIASFVQPELSKNLQQQMLTYVESGTFGDEVDISERLYGSQPMMQSLWEELSGGDQIAFSAVQKVKEEGVRANAVLPFKRSDLDYEGELNVSLEKGEFWQVVALPNLSEVLSEMEEIRTKKVVESNLKIQSEMDAAIQVLSVEKSAGVSRWGVGKGLMLRAAFENSSEKNISAFHALVSFSDEQGEVLKSVNISDSDFLEMGGVSEKSWPMGINPLSSADNFIYDATEASLTIDVKMETITFEDGSKLELISLEK